MKIKSRIMGIGIIVALLPVVVFLVLTTIQKSRLAESMDNTLDNQMKNNLESIARDMYALCKSQHESIQMMMIGNLNVARRVLSDKGAVSLSTDSIQWNAVNQVTKTATAVQLPKLLIGGTPLEQNYSGNVSTPVVDEAVKMVGGTCTIFQRMNQQGDMIRVATNVANKDGSRAIGTYIPAMNADGSANAIISTVLSGGMYKGRAMVVDNWYITAYEPLKDSTGNIIGMLYVGIKQENVESLRKAIYSVKIGKSGYVYIIGGSGDLKGKYIISQMGRSDGKNLWDVKDTKGKFFAREIVELGKQLKEDEVSFYSYTWKADEDTVARQKLIGVAYFEPWDWIICPSAYVEELAADKIKTANILNALLSSSVVAGIIVLIIAVALSFALGTEIGKPIAKLVAAANKIAHGEIDSGADVDYKANDEFGALAQAFTKMTKSLRDTVSKVRSTADRVAASAQEMSATTQEMNASSQEVARTIEDISKGASTQAARAEETFGYMEKSSASLKNVVTNAQSASNAVNRTSGQVELSKAAAQEAVDKIERITETVGDTAKIIQDLGQKSQQIGQITETITSIADQTNLLSLNAAIEAARAGEAGRGFAVVAEEVRKLAEGSAEAVRKIDGLIKSIQSETQRAVQAIEDSSGKVSEGKVKVSEIARIQGEIDRMSKEANGLVNEIAVAGQERVNEVERVVKAIDEVASIAKKSAVTSEQVTSTTEEQTASMEEMSASSQELAKLAMDLKELVAQFKLGNIS